PAAKEEEALARRRSPKARPLWREADAQDIQTCLLASLFPRTSRTLSVLRSPWRGDLARLQRRDGVGQKASGCFHARFQWIVLAYAPVVQQCNVRAAYNFGDDIQRAVGAHFAARDAVGEQLTQHLKHATEALIAWTYRRVASFGFLENQLVKRRTRLQAHRGLHE